MPTLFVGSRSGCIREVDCNSEYSADVFILDGIELVASVATDVIVVVVSVTFFDAW